ncbi:hypothetical protein [Streptomyces sp. HD]|uniref:hypothetical protein n=1 Tax=Streptomyces sp. HD TaxID=3020892 RepID=UPI00233045D0|nr:hypothetical protein [Streptomyces sp. HD]MDC0770996.1 hypothetical protein [Streptomyces sp. HD]
MRRPQLLPVGSPLQILLLACSFALAGYAGVRLLEGDWFEIALWFVGAAIVHDLVLVPLYGAADQALLRGFDAAGARGRVSYVRVPAALSLLLLLVWFPLITGRVADRYAAGTGLSPDAFLPRWLLIMAVLFGGSAVVFVLRERRLRRAAKDREPG